MNSKVANFLVIANKRCASSWLNKNLGDHPDIYMLPYKGVHFFDEHFDKGLKFYEEFFKNAGDEKRRGETEHSYFWDDRVPERIYKTLGIIPMILTVRQPVERAYSHFQLWRRFNNNRDKFSYDFEDAFMRDIMENCAETTWGFYGRQIKKYLQYFPLETFKILKYENILNNPEKEIKSVYSFLDVDSNFISASIEKKRGWATNVPEGIGSLKSKIFYTSTPTRFIRKGLRFIGLKNLKIYRPFSPPPLNIELKRKLTKYFDDDIRLFMKLTGLDLNSWQSDAIER